MPPENTLLTEIDALREQFPHTQDLYREVCVLLFFRYGQTPTANRLYQLVRKGSMSAPAQALQDFWQNLREKSRVKLEHADLPASLASSAGEMLAALWQQAASEAAQNYAAQKSAMEQAMADASATQQQELAEIRQQAQVKEQHWQQRDVQQQQALAALKQQSQQAGQALQDLQRKYLLLENEFQAVKQELADAQQQQMQQGLQYQQQQEDARREFSRQLDLLQLANQKLQERQQAAEKHALLEIDRERMLAKQLQKSLAQEKVAAAQREEQIEQQWKQRMQASVEANQTQLQQIQQIQQGREQALLELQQAREQQAALLARLEIRDMQQKTAAIRGDSAQVATGRKSHSKRKKALNLQLWLKHGK